MAAGLFLQLIVADRRRRTESVLEIAWFDQVPFSLGVMTPDTGITVGLEFHSNRKRVCLHLRHLSSEAMHLFRDAKEILHVMTDLMGDHIGLSKVTSRSKTMRHFIEEGKVQIDPVIVGAIEWTNGR
jgi:hypothetical protein